MLPRITNTFKLRFMLSIAFSGIATGVAVTNLVSVHTGVVFGVLCIMFYSSLAIFDSLSAKSTAQLKKEIYKEMDSLRSKILSAEEIPVESRFRVATVIDTLKINFLDSAVTLAFLTSNSYSVEGSVAALLHLGRLNIAKYENQWESMGVDQDIIRSFRKLTERDVNKFFRNIFRIIKSEPFLYRRQKIFKREMILLVKDVVYDYFMFLEDRNQQGLV